MVGGGGGYYPWGSIGGGMYPGGGFRPGFNPGWNRPYMRPFEYNPYMGGFAAKKET